MSDNSSVKTMFLGYLGSIRYPELLFVSKDYPDVEVFLAVSNSAQHEEEKKLMSFGFKLVNKEDKDKHPEQREAKNHYLKLWCLDTTTLSIGSELFKENVNSFKDQPGYEFLSLSKQERSNLLKDHTDYYLGSVQGFYCSDIYPFYYPARVNYLTMDAIREIKELMKNRYGIVIPPKNPLTGKDWPGIDEVNRSISYIKKMDI